MIFEAPQFGPKSRSFLTIYSRVMRHDSCLESHRANLPCIGSVQAARLIKETDSRTSSLNRNSKSEAALEHFEWPELYRNCIFPLCSTKTMIMQFKLDQDVISVFISLSIKYFDTLDKDTLPIYRLKMIFRRFCIEKNAKFQWYWKFLKRMLKIRPIFLKISGIEFLQFQPIVANFLKYSLIQLNCDPLYFSVECSAVEIALDLFSF